MALGLLLRSESRTNDWLNDRRDWSRRDWSYRHVLQKFGDYACHSADHKHDRGESGGLGKAIAHAVWRFFSVYLLKGGFKDGSRGLLMAIVYSQYVFNKYAALWALRQPGLPSPDNWKPPAD